MAGKEGGNKTLGEHLESLGHMSFPVTGKATIDKYITRFIVIGFVVGASIYSASFLFDAFQMTMAGINSVVDLLPTKDL